MFFLMTPRPPRPTLFPYTTLFRSVYGEIVRKLTPGERVRILVDSAAEERRARPVLERVGVDRAYLDTDPLEYGPRPALRSEEHKSELQSQSNLVCRLFLRKKKKHK